MGGSHLQDELICRGGVGGGPKLVGGICEGGEHPLLQGREAGTNVLPHCALNHLSSPARQLIQLC